MLHSYLLTALRHFRSNKLHTFINVSGLCIGLAASLLAGMFVLDELSFDQFQSRKEQLYRLNKVNTDPDGSKMLTSETSGMMGPTLVDEFPEVENAVRIQPWNEQVVLSVDETRVMTSERDLVFADSTFFRVFDFKLLKGNGRTALVRPSTIVLSETLAKSLFGELDPVGKTVKGINALDFEVTGIVADPPRQSHIQFTALMSWSTTTPQLGPLNFEWMNNWIAQGIATYLLLKPGTSPEVVNGKLPAFMKRHLPTRIDKYALYLQPFRDIYLHSSDIMGNQLGKNGSVQYVYTFSIIAGFILFIACVNYINISTSRSARRAREVGMRKTMGASRGQLISQFLGESFLMVVLSSLVALVILYIAVPYFNQLAGKSLPWSLVFHPVILFALAILITLVGLISGIYPSLILSGFRPSQVFSASATSRSTGQWPRYALITFQFAISISLVASMMVVYRQIEFVMTKDLGFDKEHVMVVSLTNDVIAKSEVFQQSVDRFPGVVSTSLGRTALGDGGSSTFVIPEGFQPDQVEIRMFPVDGNFMNTYGMKMSEGHFFQMGSSRDSSGVVINQAMVKRLGWADPLQKTIKFNPEDPAQPVIGIIEDFQFASLYDEVEPLVMWLSRRRPNYLSVRFTGNPAPLVEAIDEQWKDLESRAPLNYYFLDKQLAKSYANEEKLFETVVVFASLSIFISCLGLYGLVSLVLEQRTKEFGVRKVLGASAISLHLLVNQKFVIMVIAAATIAIPVVNTMANDWGSKFVYKAEAGVAPYVWAIIVTLAVMILAVSIQMIKLAVDSPVKALRQE